MKKIFTLILISFGLTMLAQAPNKMSYQAVLRDASNNLLTNTSVGVKISILQGSASGTVVYAETHTATTNINGLVSLEIGSGTVVSGAFSSITWSTGNYYIKTETDPAGGTNYTISGTSQLLSVPYALYANATGSSNEAIRYVGTSYLGQNSGVGSSGTSEGNSSNLDNIAIGNQNLNANTTGTNNIALGNDNLSHNTVGNNNVSIGKNTMNANTNGIYNTGIGNQSLQNNTTGYENVGVGSGTLIFNTTGYGNTAVGFGARTNSSALNNATAIGYNAIVSTSNSLVLGNNANVGIGTSSPTEKLEVSGKTKTTNFQMTNGATNGYVLQTDASGNGTWVNPNVASGTSALTSNYIPKWNGTAFGNSLLNQSDDRLFLGTETLFSGDFNYSRFTIASSDDNRTDFNNVLASNSNDAPWINWGKARGTLTAMQSVQNGDDLFFLNINGHDGTNFKSSANIEVTVDGDVTTNSIPSKLTFKTTQVGANNSTERLTINNVGNIGIGTSTPTEKLEINGKTKTSEIQITTGATNGYILQSDASGNGTWVNPTTLTVTETDPKVSSSSINKIPKWNGTVLTDGSIYDNGTNIGIGTINPSNKLDIQGNTDTQASVQSSNSRAYYSSASPNGQENGYLFKTYSLGTTTNRWLFGKNNSNESGSNSGSDFFINRYDDTGLYTGQPLSINRQHGTVTIGNDGVSTSANTLKINGSEAHSVTLITTSNNTTTLANNYTIVYSGTITGNTCSLPAASTCSGRVYLIVNHSSTSITTSSYITANGVTSTSVLAGNTVQLISDGSNWHKIN